MRLKIKRTIVIDDIVPYDDDHYPGMTIDQAVAYERNLSEDEQYELISDMISNNDYTLMTTEVELLGD